MVLSSYGDGGVGPRRRVAVAVPCVVNGDGGGCSLVDAHPSLEVHMPGTRLGGGL
jgi:hypothetical protein